MGNCIGNPNAGVHAALAICASLFYHDRTGKGQYIDIAQVDALLYLDMVNILYCALTNGALNPKRFGAHHYAVAPLGVFKEGKDGYVVIEAVEHQWPNFARAIGWAELITNPKFETNAKRLESRAELIAIIEVWLQSFPSNDEALKVLSEWRIPCAQVFDIGQALNHPQTRAHGMVTELEHPLLGKMPIVNTLFILSETLRQVQGPAPLLGQHNAEVLMQHLGCSTADVAQSTQAGALVEEKVRGLREKGAI